MYKCLSTLILIIIVIPFTTFTGNAAEIIDLNSLVEGGAQYDGKQIVVQGEALLEAMERGEFAWVNIYDNTNALGIWMRLSDTKKIKFFGDYKNKGDVIMVAGIFNRACKEHGGDMDIHAASVEITTSGYSVKEIISSWKAIVGGALTLITLTLAGIYIKKTRSDKKTLLNSLESH